MGRRIDTLHKSCIHSECNVLHCDLDIVSCTIDRSKCQQLFSDGKRKIAKAGWILNHNQSFVVECLHNGNTPSLPYGRVCFPYVFCGRIEYLCYIVLVRSLGFAESVIHIESFMDACYLLFRACMTFPFIKHHCHTVSCSISVDCHVLMWVGSGRHFDSAGRAFT